MLLSWHQLAAVECVECAHSPHWLVWRNSIRSVLQPGVALVPDLHSSLLLRLVNRHPSKLSGLTACGSVVDASASVLCLQCSADCLQG